MLLLHFVLGLLLSLAGIANAVPVSDSDLQSFNITVPTLNFTIQGYDPSFDYHPYSTAQIWMGKSKVTVGNVIGLELYDAVYGALDRNCPARPGAYGCHGVKNANFAGRCLKRWPAETVDCTTNIWDINGRWENPEIRHLLMSAVAGALQQVTYEKVIGPTNCFAIANTRACNVGDAVRVNFPKSDTGGPNYLHIRLYNYWTYYGTYDCCQGDKRARIDTVMDKLGSDVKAQFSAWKAKDFSRDSKCIINGWQSCP